MTVRVHATQTVKVPTGTPLCVINDDDIVVWPGGVGVGLAIFIGMADWPQIRDSVDSAILRAKGGQNAD